MYWGPFQPGFDQDFDADHDADDADHDTRGADDAGVKMWLWSNDKRYRNDEQFDWSQCSVMNTTYWPISIR